MPGFEHAFTHLLGSNVEVVGTEVMGTVNHLGLDAGGELYLVRTVDSNGQIQNEWYRGSEIIKA